MDPQAVVTLRSSRHPHVMFMRAPDRHIQMRCVYRRYGKSKRVDVNVSRYRGFGDELDVQVTTATATTLVITGRADLCVRVAVLPEHFIVISIKLVHGKLKVSVSRSD